MIDLLCCLDFLSFKYFEAKAETQGKDRSVAYLVNFEQKHFVIVARLLHNQRALQLQNFRIKNFLELIQLGLDSS